MAIRRNLQALLAATLVGLALSPSLSFAEAIRWRTNVDAAKIEAVQSNKLVLLHFWSTSCGPCKKLETNVFTQPQLGEFIEKYYVPVKVNVDLSPAATNQYQVTRWPTDVVLTPQGNVVAKLSCPMEHGAYGTQLANVAAHYQQHMQQPSAPVQPPVQSAYAGLEVGKYNNQQAVATVANNAGVTQTAGYANNPYANAPSQQGVAAAPPQATQRYGAVPASPQTVSNPYAQPAQPAVAPQPAVAAPQQAVPQQAAPQQNATAQQPPVIAQSAQPTQSPASVASQLPPGTPPLGFEGYCPVTLKTARKWVIGTPDFGAVHRGRTYLFTGEAQRQQFLANPDAFSPVFAGYDAVLMLDENKAVEGSRSFGFEYRNAFYLFSSKATMETFAKNPDRYSAQVRQAMNRLDGNLGTIRR